MAVVMGIANAAPAVLAVASLGLLLFLALTFLQGGTSKAATPALTDAPIAKPFLTPAERLALHLLEGFLPGVSNTCPSRNGRATSAFTDRSQAPSGGAERLFAEDRRFVVEDRGHAGVLALVELDDRSHRRQRDQARDRLTGSAGYRTIRIAAGQPLTEDEIFRITAVLRPSTA